MLRTLSCLPLLVIGFWAGSARSADPAVSDGLKAILAVGREGEGNAAAAAGWKAVTSAGVEALVPTLAAFADAGPTAGNWLRTAVDAIVETEKKAGRPLPADTLTAFVRDTARPPTARRIAFELLQKQEPDTAAAMLPTMIDDPSVEIRRDAINARMEAAESLDAIKKPAEYQALFAASRDKDQAEELAKLVKKTGGTTDLTRHFGYVTEWQVAGPFDGPEGSGYGEARPPESGVDLTAKYQGKGDKEFGWVYAQSRDVFGRIDLNAVLDRHKNATCYASATVVAPNEIVGEVRVNTPNTVRVFVNGQLVFEHDEYHHGDRFDQFSAPITLNPGRNEVLVKVCQNDQSEAWAQAWQFGLRFCDPTGGALPLKQVVVRDGAEATVEPGAIRPAEDKKEGAK